MVDVNLFLLGLVASQALLLTFYGIVFAKKSFAARILIPYSICILAFIVTPVVGYFKLHQLLALTVLCESLLPLFLWFFNEALFGERFRWRHQHLWGIVFVVITILTMNIGPFDDGDYRTNLPLLLNTYKISVIVLLIFSLKSIILGWRDDMLSVRLKMRSFLMLFTVICLIGVALLDLYKLPYRELNSYWFLVCMIIAFFFLLGCNVFMAFYEDLLLPWQDIRPIHAKKSSAINKFEQVVERRLIKAVREDKIFYTSGLTIAMMAKTMGLPEYQLRNYINKILGYRNFNEYLSKLRIDEAKKILSDPKNHNEKILSLALNLGFGSLAPFNRAFKNITGKTPSEFRDDYSK